MSSIASVTSASGISNLMQMLSSSAPPAVSSLLSSKNVQAGLAKASPQDIVQLSSQAMQLQMVNGFFPETDASSQAASSTLSSESLLTAIYTKSDSPASQTAASSDAPGSLVNLFA